MKTQYDIYIDGVLTVTIYPNETPVADSEGNITNVSNYLINTIISSMEYDTIDTYCNVEIKEGGNHAK